MNIVVDNHLKLIDADKHKEMYGNPTMDRPGFTQFLNHKNGDIFRVTKVDGADAIEVICVHAADPNLIGFVYNKKTTQSHGDLIVLAEDIHQHELFKKVAGIEYTGEMLVGSIVVVVDPKGLHDSARDLFAKVGPKLGSKYIIEAVDNDGDPTAVIDENNNRIIAGKGDYNEYSNIFLKSDMVNGNVLVIPPGAAAVKDAQTIKALRVFELMQQRVLIDQEIASLLA